MIAEVVPDSVAPYLGFRGWCIGFVDRDEAELEAAGPDSPRRAPVLTAVVQPEAWMPGSALRAKCLDERKKHQDAPELACSCGIYASRRVFEVRRLLMRQRYHQHKSTYPYAVGEVALWGRVALHTEGARGEFAYPRSLVVPATWRDVSFRGVARELHRSYRIPVRVVPMDEINLWGTSEWEDACENWPLYA